MKYRKKPVEIEAVVWNGRNFDECMRFMGNNGGNKIAYEDMEEGCNKLQSIPIHTLEGTMIALKGDFIIKGVKGEFYPCKPDIFDLTYEIVVETTNLYCIEVTRDSEEPFVFHAKFDHVPTREEILEEIEDQELNYDDDYGKIDFYKVN